jgi:ABC-type nitrate/sulfonate/bicarbonate transport system substrate-binding protein
MACPLAVAHRGETMAQIKYFTCLAAIIAFCALAGAINAQERVHVAISNFSASYISMHIAQKRGFYAEEGMIVEIILMAGLTSTRALIGNSVEFGSASNPTAAVQGAKLKILMVFNDKPPGEFMAQPRIKSMGELRGKRVARLHGRQLGLWLVERSAAEVRPAA